MGVVDPDTVRYEPILRFAQRERFFPLEASAFIKKCALARGDEVLVPRGGLTTAALLAHVHRSGLELVLTSVPRTRAERTTVRFHVAFALDRIRDLLNGRRNAANAPLGRKYADEAAVATADISVPAVGPAYHFHVTQSGAWKAIQYWFLYPYNDWGSARGGMNDHEGDWEMICVLLHGGVPQRLYMSAHQGGHSSLWAAPGGAVIEDGHPIVYVGLGSHAIYASVGLHHPLGAGTTMVDGVDANELPGGLAVGPTTSHPWAARIAVDDEPWASYAGTWGAVVEQVGSSGSHGPVGPWVRTTWGDPFSLVGGHPVVP